MHKPTTIKSRRIWIAAAMLFAGQMAAQTPAVRLWAVSDGVAHLFRRVGVGE